MGVIQRVVKASTHRGKRELTKREPKLIENAKSSIFTRGNKTSESVLKCLKDFAKLKKPHSVLFSKKQEFRPFEATNELETMCKKYDSAFFGFASHTKKRPNNLIIGRMFDFQILDMVELGVENYKSLDDFQTPKFAMGSKPCFTFSGEPFLDTTSDFYRIKNLLIDFFHGEEVTNIRVEGLEYVYSFVALDNKIYMRGYKIILKKSGQKTPYVELEEMGPFADFTVRRTKLASADLFKSACKMPKEVKVKKVKNISKDAFGSTLGRIHMPKQNLRDLGTRKMKALKTTMAEKKMEKARQAKENAASSSTTHVNTSRSSVQAESVVASTDGPMKLHISG